MEGLSRYLVELERPELGPEDVQRLAARSRRVSAQLCGEGKPVRFLRSVYVPEDGLCFLLLEAASPDAASEAARLAGVCAAAVTEAARL